MVLRPADAQRKRTLTAESNLSGRSSPSPSLRRASGSQADGSLIPKEAAASSSRSRKVSDSSGPAAVSHAYRYSIGSAPIRFPSPNNGTPSRASSNSRSAAQEQRGSMPRRSISSVSAVEDMEASASTIGKRSLSRRSSAASIIPRPASQPPLAASAAAAANKGKTKAEDHLHPKDGLPILADEGSQGLRPDATDQIGPPARRRSKFLTSFPFPHPSSSSSYLDAASDRGSSGIYGGPLRVLNSVMNSSRWLVMRWTQARREEEDEEANVAEASKVMERQALLAEARQKGGPSASTGPTSPNPAYGATSRPNAQHKRSASGSSVDSQDPYGYRALAGPALLPEHAARADSRRRLRDRQRWWDRYRHSTVRLLPIAAAMAALVAILLLLWYAHQHGWLEWSENHGN